MIVEMRAIKKDKEGCLVQRTMKPDDEVILIPWEEFNKTFNKTSWPNHYWVDIPDLQVEKSLEKINFIKENVSHILGKTSWTKRKISQYLKKFNSNDEDLQFHIGVYSRLNKNNLI